MHLKQFVGVGKFVYDSIVGRSFCTSSIYGFNHIHRLAKSVRASYNGKVSPDILGIEITNYCSRDCKGCYIPPDMKADKTVIDESLLRSTISQAKKEGIRIFGFMGGEPMRADTIPPTINVASENPFISFVYCTNSDYIASNDVAYFTNYPNIAFILSIDGFKASNDSWRGKNSFSNLMAASGQLKELRRQFSASVTVRRENLEEVLSYDFVNYLSNQGFKYIVWVKYRENGSKEGGTEISNREFIDNLSRVRKATMTNPVFQHTNIVGDFFTFNKKTAHHTIYVGVNGDVHLERENISAYRGNLHQKSLECILKEISVDYRLKYPDSIN